MAAPAAAAAQPSVLGSYGAWLASCVGNEGAPAPAATAAGQLSQQAAPTLSYRHPRFAPGLEGLGAWRQEARAKAAECLLLPDLAAVRAAAASSVEVGACYDLDGVVVTELSWQLPYGPRTRALFLRPVATTADRCLAVWRRRAAPPRDAGPALPRRGEGLRAREGHAGARAPAQGHGRAPGRT